MFQDLEKQLGDAEEQRDTLGGGYTVPSDVYEATVKVVYFTKAQNSEAQCANVVLSVGDKEITDRLWFTNKKNEPFYTSKQGKKMRLPGYETLNDLCVVTTGKPLAEHTTEEKTIKVWDPETRGEVDKSMPVLTAVIGKPLHAAILRVIENKQEKNDATGAYEDTNEKRTRNEISKLFIHQTKQTAVEYAKGVELAEGDMFMAQWIGKNAGKDRDNFNEVGSAGPAPSGGTGKPGGTGGGQSLFA